MAFEITRIQRLAQLPNADEIEKHCKGALNYSTCTRAKNRKSAEQAGLNFFFLNMYFQ